ncbi:MAG: ATP synthase F1 subunit gamma [Candidatus Bipolaricaulota bacterium]
MAQQTRQILRRIENVSHVKQITKAMYAIAATQVIQRKRALRAARPFTDHSPRVLGELWAAARAEGLSHPWFEPGEGEGNALLVVNADRGLCGRYVGEVNRAAESLARASGRVKVLAGGEKARAFFRNRGWEIAASYTHAYERPDLAAARRILADVLELFPSSVKEVHVVHMGFRGELVQKVEKTLLLPLQPPPAAPGELVTEPALDDLLGTAAEVSLLGRLLWILLEAKASEQAIRRQAMKTATDNADELIDDLTLTYNKARQHGITRELADIVGGSEALREAR